ncbi:MAG TPA: ribosome small subunit-dependent GTPase A [Burkholderiaceae bacterium]|nr:ribosome small subunit-dependent GTPase A [Burkholderiaceae bacterium]
MLRLGLENGLVVAGFGRHVLVETPNGERLICHPRGKKSSVVVGDKIQWLASKDEGTIEKIEPRKNLFYRQDEVRTKSFAANLDQVLILVAAEPEFSENQLARALIAAEAEHIKPIVALNKSDLTEPFARAWARLQPYRDMGYELISLALKPKSEIPDFKAEISAEIPQNDLLTRVLEGKTTLVLGPSGSGKSTLINTLLPNAKVLTQEISQALNSGKHTTTSTTWYWLDDAKTTALIDSPGFQEFGLKHIDAMHLASYMPDFKVHVPECKFYNCTHLHEPGCGVINSMKLASSQHKISLERYRIYSSLFAELSDKRY